MSDNKEKGDRFEKYVASLYEALNFSVEIDKNISGQQVDVYAQKNISGIGSIKLIIECKYLEKGSVSNQIVYDFNSFIRSISNVDSSYKGVIVTNRGFSKDSKKAASDFNISLITQEILENEIFESKEPFINIKTVFERQDIFKEFIPLFGSVEGINRRTSNSKELVNEISSINFQDWRKITFINILADYGSGKTTLLKRLNYVYAIRHLEGAKQKPIYLELKHFELYKDLTSFLVNSFIKLFQREISIETIFERINSGDFIFLLDGFDEMSPQVDRKVRVDNLIKLSPILLSKSNTILTCRPSYFVSKKEFDDAIEILAKKSLPLELDNQSPNSFHEVNTNKRKNLIYNKLINKYTDSTVIKKESSKVGSNPVIIKIHPFNNSQIEEYLKKFSKDFNHKCNSSWSEIKEFLENIYDISDLLKKPILLSMIKDTIIELGEDYKLKNQVLDASSLYETYTKANLHREFSKGKTRQLLTNSERDHFAEAIALLMFEKDSLNIKYDNLLELVKNDASIVSKINFIKSLTYEQVASDIQICSFIERTENDEFKFIHKSYMEFYVAKQLKRAFRTNTKSQLEDRNIQKEILFFLGSYIYSDSSLKQKMLKNISSKFNRKKFLKRNILYAYINTAKNFRKLFVNNINAEHISIEDKVFTNCKLWDIQFYECSLSNLKFENNTELKAKFKNTRFDFSKIISSYLLIENNVSDINSKNEYFKLKTFNSELTLISKITIVLNSSLFYDSRININCDSFHLSSCKMKETKINLFDASIIFSSCYLDGVDFSNGKVKKQFGKKKMIEFDSSILRSIDLSLGKEEYFLSIDKCTFKNSHFNESILLQRDDKSLKDIHFIDCKGSITLINNSERSIFTFFDHNRKKVKLKNKDGESVSIKDLTIIISKE